MSVGSNPTPDVDFSNEQEELLLEMMEELLVVWLKLRLIQVVKVASDHFSSVKHGHFKQLDLPFS